MLRHTPIFVLLALVLAAFAAACASGGGKSTVAVAARPSAGCSQAAPPAGLSEQTLTVGAESGTYREMVPSAAAATEPLPLIIDLHGRSTAAADQASITGFETLGEQEGAFVLTPSGLGPAPGNNSIDFLTELLDASEQRLCIDTARVFMGGMSGGGIAASTAGCPLADRIAAIGVASGIVFPAECELSRPLPVIAFYGKLDTVIQYYGGIGYNLTSSDPAPPPPTSPPADTQGFPPVETIVAQWAAANGCLAEPEATQVSEHVELRTFGGCSGDSAVEFYVISNGNHAWPGADLETFDRVYENARAIGIAPTQEIKATPLLWEFWLQHPLAP